MQREHTLWPDDDQLSTSRDGLLARLGGNQLYFFSRSLLAGHQHLLSEHRAALTRHVVENAGENPVEFSTYNIEQVLSRRPPSVREKLHRLMRAVAEAVQFQVETAFLDLTDAKPLPYEFCRRAGLRDTEELWSLLRHAHSQRLVNFDEYSGGASVTPTVSGLIQVEEQSIVDAPSRAGFVAMWFGSELASAYAEGIAPAIEGNGFEPVRIDNREYNNRIDDEIISEIRRARFLVADFSCGPDGARGGVYFEAGFALALDKPVIFTVREADLPRVHFDTRQFNHIVWQSPVDLRERLTNRIGATIGRLTAE